ncbi:MAG: hypothetical protein M3290_09675, partial [Actinomycetota bacterium]|nr:hypothetical protein [Actinomycetota bacterium]
MMLKKVSVVLLVVTTLGGAACGGRVQELGPHEAAAQPVALARPVDATPVFAVKLDNRLDETIPRVSAIPGVAAVTTVRVGKIVV